MSNPNLPAKIDNIADLVNKYELFVLDIFGVIHDGNEPYPKMMDALKTIKLAGKQICFLSNAPRRADKAEAVLNKFGIDDDFCDYVLTSGEYAFHHFVSHSEAGEKFKYYYLGPEKDRDLLNGSGHQEVSDPTAADFAIATGLDLGQQVSDIADQLEALKAAKLKLYCINPDKTVHKQSGLVHICAGSVAAEYSKMGGEVEYFGKPYQGIYEELIAEFLLPKNKILCVGDGLETDIKGANQFGLDSLFITSGMFSPELEQKIGEDPDPEKLAALIAKHGWQPNYYASLFA